jgi:hypothetical protein
MAYMEDGHRRRGCRGENGVLDRAFDRLPCEQLREDVTEGRIRAFRVEQLCFRRERDHP